MLRRPDVASKTAILGASLLAFALFLSTLQLDINGSRSDYATDVGEIQNALPRWGIIHFNGYPLYSMLGSAFVTVLRSVGIPPALAASLFSAMWGAVSVGLLVALALFLRVPPSIAAVCALLLAVSTSTWVDASIAEVHTMTVALTLGSLLAALHFHRSGRRRDLLWLAFLTGQIVAHQPASVLLLPALAVLVLSRWRTLQGMFWQVLPVALGLALLGPLTYLYLPIRVWQGADWVFGTPDTWEGFLYLTLDTDPRSYIISVPHTWGDWIARSKDKLGLLRSDLPLLILFLGAVGLLVPACKRHWSESVALSFVWIPWLFLVLTIRELSDALLAATLPVTAMAALGTAILAGASHKRSAYLGAVITGIWLGVAGFLCVQHRPTVLDITRDPGAEQVIDVVAQLEPAPDGKPVVLTTLWGMDYWALVYAQEYRGEFPDVRLVKHDADFQGILERGEHLVTLSRTFYVWPLDEWRKLLGPIHVSSFAPNIIEMSKEPPVREADVPPGKDVPLGNGVTVRYSSLSWTDPDTLVLTVYWQAGADGLQDHSVAVHLVGRDPPSSPEDILLQADRDHPVSGWYPVSQWRADEIVRDHYLMQVPRGTAPQAVRFNMYQSLGNGEFRNTLWLSLPVPPRTQ